MLLPGRDVYISSLGFYKCKHRFMQVTFYLQSEPEEMPPEAKMRMKNIGRYILYFSNSFIEVSVPLQEPLWI